MMQLVWGPSLENHCCGVLGTKAKLQLRGEWIMRE